MADFEEKKRQAAEQYVTLRDEELAKLAGEAWSLTDAGKQALTAELARRGLATELATAPPQTLPLPNLVTLKKFRDTPAALLARGALESAGVECFLLDETTIRMDWLWSNALGGIKLCVRPEDAESAKRLLDQGIPETFDVEGIGDYQQPHCPKCNSLDISWIDLDRFSAYGGMFVGLPIPVKDTRWKCESCGHEWKPVDEPKT